MSVSETPKATAPSQIVTLDKALKLAEGWVNNMSKAADYESTETDMEGRPSRLGLGAKVSRQSIVALPDDPAGRKLHAKLEAEKRKTARNAKESNPSTRDGVEDDDDDADQDSRTNAFSKRKAVLPLTSSKLGNKKQK